LVLQSNIILPECTLSLFACEASGSVRLAKIGFDNSGFVDFLCGQLVSQLGVCDAKITE
jgi:hypothetical protein